jgi:hypothetical protein
VNSEPAFDGTAKRTAKRENGKEGQSLLSTQFQRSDVRGPEEKTEKLKG